MIMSVALVIVTHNRLEYTRKCLDALLRDKSDFDLYLWDNASTDGTKEYLAEALADSRVKEVTMHPGNPGPTFAMNQIWSKTKADLIGKIDNDCLMPAGWLECIEQAHKDVDRLGAVACWHFREEDFNVTIGNKKIQTFGRHRIFRHPWVCGSGFLLKRSTYERIGPCSQGDRRHALTGYFMSLALAGYINGWYFPLVTQEHMDDPVSSHCLFNDDQSMEKLREVTYVLRTHNIKTYRQRLERRNQVLRTLHYGPIEPEHYIGLRGKLRRRIPLLDVCLWKMRNRFQNA